jgi:uncharacterized membrane protein
MADLVEITFPSEEKAEEVRQKLLDMQKEYLIELGDAVIAVKRPNGHVKLNQLFNPTASGAVSGTFWGALIGMIFLMPLAGAAIGAASGALGGKLADVGINDRFMRCRAKPAIRQCSTLPAGPQNDNRQGLGGLAGRGRHGDPYIL